MTVRETINEIRNELSEHPPQDAMSCSEYIVKLSALMGNIHDEIGRTESLHHQNMSQMLDEDPKMGVEKLKIKAQAMPAYGELQTAKRVSELATEMIQGLKYRARALEAEWKEARHQ